MLFLERDENLLHSFSFSPTTIASNSFSPPFSNPSLVCPSTRLLSLTGRATASRTTSDESGYVVAPGRAERRGQVLRHLVAERPPSSHIDEVAPRWAEQQGTVLRHLVAARPLAPSSSTWSHTTSGGVSSAAVQQACLLRSRATMIAPAPPVPISPISGHTGEAAWSSRDIPLAGSLGTELRSRATEARRSRWLQRATSREQGAAAATRRWSQTPATSVRAYGKCARWTDPQGGTSKGR